MEELTERIELYLKGELSEEERVSFEIEIQKNKELANSVRLQQKATELLEAKAWLATKEKVTQLNNKRRKREKRTLFLRVAAVFIGVGLLSISYIINQLSNENLHAQYFTTYPDRVSVMGDNNSELEKIMTLYNQQQYSKAAEAFKLLRESGGESGLSVLYEAISLQKTNEGSIAVELLTNHELKELSLKEVFAWQLILAHLSIGNDEKSLELLNEYEAHGYTYQSEKTKLLKEDLLSIWKF